VILDFLASWDLFRDTYVAGWLIAALLATVGVWVVARDQVFLGVAVSQASALGIAVALWVGYLGGDGGGLEMHGELFPSTLAVAAAIATALVGMRRQPEGGESPEAATAWVFLLAGSVPVLLLSGSPHGLEEVHRLMFSTLLGASASDAWILGAAGLATVVALLLWHRPLLLLAMDPEMASAIGIRRRAVGIAVAVWLGLCVGLAMRVSGMLYSFGCLVLPGLAARSLSREMGPVLWRAPLLAVAAAVPAFVLANGLDMPPAHATVAMLCTFVGLGWLFGRRG